MEFRPADRLILLMLTEIYDALKIDNREVDPAFVRSALFGGHDWAFDWKMTGISEVQPVERKVVTDVVNILDMHSLLELSYDALSPADQAKIADAWRLKFRGFDGNHETEYMSVARFMVDDMDRFAEFKGRDFNSHAPTVARALAMYGVFEPIRNALGSRASPHMTVDELQRVLAAF